jgi:hypothetical protein
LAQADETDFHGKLLSKGKKECSFLKKRTKKLLPVAYAAGRRAPKVKSFLLLFFKKEGLSSFKEQSKTAPACHPAAHTC